EPPLRVRAEQESAIALLRDPAVGRRELVAEVGVADGAGLGVGRGSHEDKGEQKEKDTHGSSMYVKERKGVVPFVIEKPTALVSSVRSRRALGLSEPSLHCTSVNLVHR